MYSTFPYTPSPTSTLSWLTFYVYFLPSLFGTFFLHAQAVSFALAYMLIVARNPVYCVHIKLLVLVSGLVFKLNVIHFVKIACG